MMRNIKRIGKYIATTGLLIATVASVGFAPRVLADAAGGSGGGNGYRVIGGGGGSGSCWFGTARDCGAVWMYYTIDTYKGQAIPGSISIPDAVVYGDGKNELWLEGTSDDIAGICRWEKTGETLEGFWHYGALGRRDGNWEGYQLGTSTMRLFAENPKAAAGDYSTRPVSNKASVNLYTRDSHGKGYEGVLGATAQRIGSSSEARSAYEELIKTGEKYGIDFTGGKSFEDVGWFCVDSSDPSPSSYFAASWAAGREGEAGSGGSSDFIETKIVGNDSATVADSDDATVVQINGTATLTFTHSVYASRPEEDFAWKVERDVEYSPSSTSRSNFESWNNYYEVKTSNSSYSSGTTSHTYGPRTAKSLKDAVVQDGVSYYQGEDKGGWGFYQGADGSGSYNLRGVFEITFKKAGEYKFCESAYVGKEASDLAQATRVCWNVEVQDGTDSSGGGSSSGGGTPMQLCQRWAPDSYTISGQVRGSIITGETSVMNRIQNDTITTSRKNNAQSAQVGWQDTVIYAKPTDKITWINCYYPGVQKLATEMVSTEDSEPSWSTSTKPKKFSEYISWSNEFKVNSWTDASAIFAAPTSVVLQTNASTSIKTLSKTERDFEVSVKVGVSDVKLTTNTYAAKKKDDAGKTYKETITSTGTPCYVEINLETHTWYPHCCCCSESCSCGDGDDEEGIPDSMSCCCCSETCDCYEHTDNFHGYNYADSSSSDEPRTNVKKTDNARVEVPYNFNNSLGFTLNSPAGSVVYAGERMSISGAFVKVGTRRNNVTNDTYSTQVDDAEVKMIAYVSTSSNGGGSPRAATGHGVDLCSLVSSKQCTTINSLTGTTLNASGNLTGYTESGLSGNYGSFNDSYNVFDASAGDYFCVVMGMYPATSGTDTMLDPSGDNKWRLTSPQCKVIAKKPTFEIYGGDLYTSGSLMTSTMVKQNFYRVTSYQPKSLSGATVLGSWVEQGIVANGAVNGLASGATLANNSSSRINKGSPESGTTSGATNFCNYRTPLTFANSGVNANLSLVICNNGGTTAGYAGVETDTLDRASLVSYWVPASTDDSITASPYTSVTLNSRVGEPIESATGRAIRYIKTTGYLDNGTYRAGDLRIYGSTIGARETYIVRATDTVTIAGNIIYTSNTLNSAGDVPKVVIYAKNININCSVTEVDAILIADEEVNTCADAGGVDDRNRDNQLNIRGVVIANSLTLPRTYGAASGRESGTPAEILNYDTSSILWGRYMAGAGESDTMTTVYQLELAPRY